MNTKNNILIAKILTYLGTIPLVGATILFIIPIKIIDPNLIAFTYSAIIIAFLSGIHWAIYLFFSEKCPQNLFIISNITSLIVCLCYILSFKGIYFVYTVCFLCLLIIDTKLYKLSILPRWFYSLRLKATLIVIICLSIIAFLSEFK
jgi:hypothetical protein